MIFAARTNVSIAPGANIGAERNVIDFLTGPDD